MKNVHPTEEALRMLQLPSAELLELSHGLELREQELEKRIEALQVQLDKIRKLRLKVNKAPKIHGKHGTLNGNAKAKKSAPKKKKPEKTVVARKTPTYKLVASMKSLLTSKGKAQDANEIKIAFIKEGLSTEQTVAADWGRLAASNLFKDAFTGEKKSKGLAKWYGLKDWFDAKGVLYEEYARENITADGL